MPATLEMIKERLDELERQLLRAVEEGRDATQIRDELARLHEQFNAAVELAGDGKRLLKG
jgi:hypothetical protein